MPGYGLSGSSCSKCACGAADCPSGTTSSCLAGFNLNNGKCECPAGKVADASCGSCVDCSARNTILIL